MTKPEAQQSPRRRRKRSEARRTGAAVVTFTEKGGLTRVMIIVAAAFVLIGAGRINLRTAWYGDNAIGDTSEMVRYAMGGPDEEKGSQERQTWHYRDGGNLIVVSFSGKRVVQIACTAQPGSTRPCPEMFGLTDRNGEYDVLVTLGHPDRVSFEGEVKVVHYDALGLSFGYVRRQVTMIQVSNRREQFAGTLARYARILMP